MTSRSGEDCLSRIRRRRTSPHANRAVSAAREFRRRHLDEFERMFVEVVRVAREMGMVRFGTLSVDGTFAPNRVSLTTCSPVRRFG